MNPYDSPSTETAPKQPEPPKAGFCFLAMLGMGALFVGYMGTVLLAFDIFAERGGSPLEEVFTAHYQQWLFLALAFAMTTAGAILVGGSRFEPILAVVYILCPIMAFAFALGSPLRLAKKWTLPIAFAYLMIGTGVAGTSIVQLVHAHGQVDQEFNGLLACLGTELGLALAVGALVKLWYHKPEEPETFAANQVAAS